MDGSSQLDLWSNVELQSYLCDVDIYWTLEEDGEPRVFLGGIRVTDGKPQLTTSFGEQSLLIDLLDGAHEIAGRCPDGTHVTLWSPKEARFMVVSSSRNSVVDYVKDFHLLLIGSEPLLSSDAAVFRSSSCVLVGLTGFIDPDNTQQPAVPVHLHGVYADEDSKGYDVRISFEPLANSIEGDGYRETVRAVFECNPAAPMAIYDLLKVDLQALLALARQAGSPVIQERVVQAHRGIELRVVRADGYAGPRGETLRYISPSRYLITAAHVDSQKLFERWWRVIEEFYPVGQIVCARFYWNRLYREASCLVAFTALEALFGVLMAPIEFAEKSAERDRFKALLTKEFDYLESSHKKRILREFEDKNSFKTKLDLLLNEIPAEVRDAIRIKDEDWSAGVVRVRNQLAHRGSHVAQRGRSQGEDLRALDNAARALLIVFLLRELGLDQTDKLQHAGWNIVHF